MVGALAIMFAMGIILGGIGDNVPIWKDFIGGGTVLVLLASSFLVYKNVLPKQSVNVINNFMKKSDFLDLYISVLITGSILGISRKIFFKSIVGYIPTILGGIALSFLFGTIGGIIFGIPVKKIILFYVLPVMGGGCGAGAIPMSQIFASVTGKSADVYFSFAISILTIANIICIIIGALSKKIGEAKPTWTGNGKLLIKGDYDTEEKSNIKVTIRNVSNGLLLSSFFYVIGVLFSKYIFKDAKIHTFAYMILFVVIFNAFNLIPEDIKQGAKKLQQFFASEFLWVLMVGVGVTYTNLKGVIAAFTFANVIIAFLIVLGGYIGAASVGRLVGFYPIEAGISAGLCMANSGGAGDLAVLGAADRIEMIPFAQISSRIGGGMMLIIGSILFSIFL